MKVLNKQDFLYLLVFFFGESTFHWDALAKHHVARKLDIWEKAKYKIWVNIFEIPSFQYQSYKMIQQAVWYGLANVKDAFYKFTI